MKDRKCHQLLLITRVPSLTSFLRVCEFPYFIQRIFLVWLLFNAENVWSQVALKGILKSALPALPSEDSGPGQASSLLSQSTSSLLPVCHPARRGGWAPWPCFQLRTSRPESGLETGLGRTAGKAGADTWVLSVVFVLCPHPHLHPQSESSLARGYLYRVVFAGGQDAPGVCRSLESPSLFSLPVPAKLKLPHL